MTSMREKVTGMHEKVTPLMTPGTHYKYQKFGLKPTPQTVLKYRRGSVGSNRGYVLIQPRVEIVSVGSAVAAPNS